MPPLQLHLYRAPSVAIQQPESQPIQQLGKAAIFQMGTKVILGKSLPIWQVTGIEQSQMDFSFERASSQLSELPRMFIEPDGSFVWRGPIDPKHDCEHPTETSLATRQRKSAEWQLDGMLYDNADRLVRVEVSGQCPLDYWNQFTECIQPGSELIAYLMDLQCCVFNSDLLQLWERQNTVGD